MEWRFGEVKVRRGLRKLDRCSLLRADTRVQWRTLAVGREVSRLDVRPMYGITDEPFTDELDGLIM